jgi:hypothetical protein
MIGVHRIETTMLEQALVQPLAQQAPGPLGVVLDQPCFYPPR